MSDQLLTASLRTAIRYAPVAVKEPENYEARGQLMWLSSLACNGILSTGCQYGGWSCHGIEMAEHAVEANWLSYAYVPLDKNDVKEILNMCI